MRFNDESSSEHLSLVTCHYLILFSCLIFPAQETETRPFLEEDTTPPHSYLPLALTILDKILPIPHTLISHQKLTTNYSTILYPTILYTTTSYILNICKICMMDRIPSMKKNCFEIIHC